MKIYTLKPYWRYLNRAHSDPISSKIIKYTEDQEREYEIILYFHVRTILMSNEVFHKWWKCIDMNVSSVRRCWIFFSRFYGENLIIKLMFLEEVTWLWTILGFQRSFMILKSELHHSKRLISKFKEKAFKTNFSWETKALEVGISWSNFGKLAKLFIQFKT